MLSSLSLKEKKMRQNLGNIDKAVRILLAVGVVLLYAFGVINGWIAILAFILGSVFALTSFAGVCPLYIPFKLNTKKS